jgi:hypothetical protein
MAKTAKAMAKQAVKSFKKKALQRQLEVAKAAHLKAEQKTGKLRERLDRAEARLAKKAEQLVATQALLEQAHAPAKAAKDVPAVPAEPAPPAERAKHVDSSDKAASAAKASHAAKARTAKKAADPALNGKGTEKVAAQTGTPAGTISVHEE